MTEQSLYVDHSNSAIVVPKQTIVRFCGVDDIGIVIDRPMDAIEVLTKTVDMLNSLSAAVGTGRKHRTEANETPPAVGLLDRVRIWLLGK